MRHETLWEHELRVGLELDPAERDALIRTRAVQVTPTVGTDDSYDLRPSSMVGVVGLGETLQITIKPKLNVSELFFLISYAIDPGAWPNPMKHWRDEHVQVDERLDLHEALVPAFLRLLHRALGRGVLQGYRTEEDALLTVRGRIRFGEQIRRRFDSPLPIEVAYDEFTEDIELNRVLRAAISRLARMPLRRAEHREGLRAYDTALERVSLVPYPNAPSSPAYTRLNEHYRGAVEMARLIIDSTSIAVDKGGVLSSAFLIDMNKVFERFALVALRETLGLDRSAFPAGAAGHGLWLDERPPGSIALEPDLSWWEQDGRASFVGDLKYKQTEVAEVKHADIYQLLAYTVALDLPAGLLIYAAGETDVATHTVRHVGKRLEVRALDVSGDPESIRRRVVALADRIRVLRNESLALRKSAARAA